MKKLITLVLAALGIAASSAATVGCIVFWVEEPVAPKSLLK